MQMNSSEFRVRFVGGESYGPVGKIVCVGRNYAAHARELNNPVPREPILFIKPATALTALDKPLRLPANRGECHYETEIAVLIGERLSHCDKQQAQRAIAGFGVALDLTLRDLQSQLKEKGQPWEKAKSFDGACPISAFVAPDAIADLASIPLRLTVNREVVQDDSSARMLFPILDLLVYISTFFTLLPGDIVLTGTPEGVGPLHEGDRLKAELVGLVEAETTVSYEC